MATNVGHSNAVVRDMWLSTKIGNQISMPSYYPKLGSQASAARIAGERDFGGPGGHGNVE